MFIAQVEDEDKTLALKPMNCPCHMQIFRQGLRSYRELPLRLAEFGSCHRYEPSGALHGIMRVRAFTQDDAHIFCTEEQIAAETVRFVELLTSIYRDFGFPEFRVKLADRPALRVGTDAVWDQAEDALKEACATAGVEYTLNPGEGAFYGPKLEFVLRDAIGRDWQCGTLQVDFNTAGTAGRGICRRGRRPPPPGHAAPRHPRQLRALPRHPDRALCRPVPAVAGAGAGGGRDHRLRRRRVCREVAAALREGGAGGRARPDQPEDQRQGARAQPGACAGAGGGRPEGGGEPARSRCAGWAAQAQEVLPLDGGGGAACARRRRHPICRASDSASRGGSLESSATTG